jgi:hypothetical protein
MAPRSKKKASLYDVINARETQVDRTICDDRGIYLDMPFLRFGYNWYGLLTVDPSLYDRLKATKISRDHIPEQGIVLHQYVVNRMKFLNLVDSPANFAKTE